MIKSIVYTSNTGYTEEYAHLLGEKTGLPVLSLKEAAKKLEKNTEIIYLGWITANSIKDYKRAASTFSVKAVCGVGLMGTGEKTNDMRKASGVPDNVPVFSLQGGFDIRKLHGIYKLMMKIMVKAIVKEAMEKPKKTQKDLELAEIMQNGGSYVNQDNLSAILEWYKQLR